jgi:hypothetical protein
LLPVVAAAQGPSVQILSIVSSSWSTKRPVCAIMPDMLHNGDLDEAPQAYRRSPDVLAHHAGSVPILHRWRAFAVAMAGEGEFGPFKD